MMVYKVTDKLPEPGVKVIAFFRNECDKKRIIMAYHAPRFTLKSDDDDENCVEYCEEKDAFFLTEGWYENNEFDEVNWKVDGDITHWMPLPEFPEG